MNYFSDYVASRDIDEYALQAKYIGLSHSILYWMGECALIK